MLIWNIAGINVLTEQDTILKKWKEETSSFEYLLPIQGAKTLLLTQTSMKAFDLEERKHPPSNPDLASYNLHQPQSVNSLNKKPSLIDGFEINILASSFFFQKLKQKVKHRIITFFFSKLSRYFADN